MEREDGCVVGDSTGVEEAPCGGLMGVCGRVGRNWDELGIEMETLVWRGLDAVCCNGFGPKLRCKIL